MNGYGRSQASPTSPLKNPSTTIQTPHTVRDHSAYRTLSPHNIFHRLQGHWFELVSKEAVIFLNHYLDYHALTGRRDFLGIKQLLQKDPKFGEYLATAPTCGAPYVPMNSKTVGSAWQS